ncbi:MAG: guanylate kinase [Bacteroidota bacterium]
MKGKLIILSAPSGSGKTTILKYLLQKDLNLEFSVSATSRKKRTGEIHGKDYYFLSPDQFRKKIDNDEFLEYEEVYAGLFYGTLKSEVERIREKGKHVIFDVDVIGGINIKKQYGNEALAIFVKPPSLEELERRLRKRSTETEEIIRIRLDKAGEELTYANQFDTIVVNNDLAKAKKETETKVREFTGQ